MVGIEPTMALPPANANLPFRSPPTTMKRGDLVISVVRLIVPTMRQLQV
jgi:hypothetical protein